MRFHHETKPLLVEIDVQDKDEWITMYPEDSEKSGSDSSETTLVKRSFTYDEAINLLGTGRFHWMLVLICGWANATDAVEVMCVSLVLTSAACELDINSNDLAVLTAIIFLGMLIGGYFWGALGDSVGRKKIMVFSLLMNGVFGFLSAFANSYWNFLLCRFLSGVGVGGSIPVFWSYFVEFQPTEGRGTMLSCIAAFWMIGQLITGGLAWILMPRQSLDLQLGTMQLRSWRVFLILSTVICLTSAFLVLFLPESPKFLYKKGRREEALKIIRKIYATNYGVKESDCPIKQLDKSDKESLIPNLRRSIFRQSVDALKSMFTQTIELFRYPSVKPMVCLCAINFCLSFGYYGLNLWFPELFTRSRAANAGGSICSVAGALSNATFNTTGGRDCRPETIGNPTVFRDDFLIALSQLPGNLVCIFLLDRLGRKPVFVVGIVLSAISIFIIYAVKAQWQVLLLSCVFGGVSVMCWNCLDAFSTELFPTSLRSTALGVSLVFARIGAIVGNLAFGLLIDKHCEIPILIVAALLAIGGVTSLFLTEPSHKAIE